MLDDLDLAWEEQESRRRGRPTSRQARQRRRKEAKRKRRSWGALLISMLLLVVLGGGVYWGVGYLQDAFGADDYTTNPGKVPVTVKVNSGDGGSQIGLELYEKKVVASVKAFVNAYEADPNSRKIQPGAYKLFEELPAAIALSYLLDPAKYMVTNKVTIQEGWTMFKTFDELSKVTKIPVQEFKDAAPEALKTVPDYWFKRGDGKKAIKSVEGFLFPDTYLLDPELNAQEILEVMINQFLTVAGELKFTEVVEAERGGVSPHEALVVASLAQVEAGNEKDLPKIARVAYNRAYTDAMDCQCLQFDVTVNYWLLSQGKKGKTSSQMTQAELHNTSNPWNTGYGSKGVPAGAISSPGRKAMEAAMRPASGNWLYFVAVDKQGNSKFTNDLDVFEQYKQEARDNGVL